MIGKRRFTAYYTGCVDSGNLGDDCLLPVFVAWAARALERRWGARVQAIERPAPEGEPLLPWIQGADLGVVGGGSLLHPEEISYTVPTRHSRHVLLFGTGCSDSPRFPLGLANVEAALRGEYAGLPFADNESARANFAAVHRAVHGGLRGPMDDALARRAEPAYAKRFVYDPGMLAARCWPPDPGLAARWLDLPVLPARLAAVNLAWVSASCRIGSPDESTGDFNEAVYRAALGAVGDLLDRGYAVACYAMGGPEVEIHQRFRSDVLVDRPGAPVHCPDRAPTVPEILGLCAAAHVAVATRLHAGVLCAAAGTPLVLLMYGYKSIGFADSVGILPYAVPTHQVSASRVRVAVRRLERDHAAVAASLARHARRAAARHDRALRGALAASLPASPRGANVLLCWDRPSKTTARLALYW